MDMDMDMDVAANADMVQQHVGDDFDMIDFVTSDALNFSYDNAMLGSDYVSSAQAVGQRQDRSSKAKVRGGEAHSGKGTGKRQKRSLTCPVCTM